MVKIVKIPWGAWYGPKEEYALEFPDSWDVQEFPMRDAPDIAFILEDARRNGYPPGQQRAFVMAKVLEKAHVIIVGSECPDIVAACKMIPAATMNEALQIAAGKPGTSCDVLIVPHALLTLPVVQEK